MTTDYQDLFFATAYRPIPWENLPHEGIRAIGESFDANLRRIRMAATLPHIIRTITRHSAQYSADAAHEVWGDDARKPHGPSDPKWQEFVGKINTRFEARANAPATTKDAEEAFDLDIGFLNLLESLPSNDSLNCSDGFRAIKAGAVAGIWTAFEILASDLWVEALNSHPAELADLAGKNPKAMPRDREPLPATATRNPRGPNEERLLRVDYLRLHGYNLSRSMGTILSEKYNFQTLDGMREAYVRAFCESHSGVREAILHPSVKALAETRHAITHKAGKADPKFMMAHGHCAELSSAFPNAESGKLLDISGEVVAKLTKPVVEQAIKLLLEVSAIVGPDNEGI
ncbi:hypothetical protein [Limnoglobus roseus]|uniref:Uncharacterized protein n=1 Tax=Limnoglobus roseus TaxID=2598579 RepID=A0A5C1AF49_9BACT|nr:hypothetical protein [Limnoglobus roseus]QEL16352.1 hypothetical protein PX52LOC_03300 [Limnoglobus roseus]